MLRNSRSTPRGILLACSIGFTLAAVVTLPAQADQDYDTDLTELLVRRYYRAINEGDVDAADAILTTDFIKYNNGEPPKVVGPEVLKQTIRGHVERNTTYGFFIEDVVSKADKVVVRWVWKSTNIEWGSPSEVTSQGISIFRFEGEKIAELWQAFDVSGFQEQLGFTVTPPSAVPMSEQK